MVGRNLCLLLLIGSAWLCLGSAQPLLIPPYSLMSIISWSHEVALRSCSNELERDKE